MPSLAITRILYRDPICHDWDYQSIIDFLPLEHVKSSDGVAEDVDAMDGGAASIRHYLGVVLPVEFGVNVNIAQPYRRSGRLKQCTLL